MAKKKGIDPKDAAAFGMKMRGASNAQIAKALGHKSGTKNSAEAAVSRRLRRVKDSDALVEALEKYGATDQVIIQTVMECLVAQHTMVARNPEGDEVIKSPDYQVRLRAAELLGRWSGWDKTHIDLNATGDKPVITIAWPGAARPNDS